MSSAPISRSPDLHRLVEAGYEVAIRANHLVVSNVPYVNAKCEVKRGALISTLVLQGDCAVRPDTHVMMFSGDYPCHQNGESIEGLQHSAPNQRIDEDLVARFSFSNKPPGGYVDYFHKFDTYARIISGPAQALDPSATPRTFIPRPPPADSVFEYFDTASARAGISEASARLVGRRVGIVGLGGTGGYVLDFVSKTPIEEIHLFDVDVFHTHSAFRAPGAASLEELRAAPRKVQYFAERYSKMHRGIVPHECAVDETTVSLLGGLDFAFLCIDRPEAKGPIIDFLEGAGISFIDAGMGIELVDGQLGGIVRVTTSTPKLRDHFRRRVSTEGPGEDDAYVSNIQIAELNALNAVFAVLKWKKLCGFYRDLEHEHHSVFTTDCNQLLSGESPCED
jgi:hypothetical protein